MSELPDKRLLDRSLRKAEARAGQVADQLGSLPDLADKLRRPSDEEIESLRQELAGESARRAEKIQRQLLEDRTPRQQAPVAVVPFDAEL
jgi:hypothetical protein